MLNDRNELLVIAERYGWDKVKRWKLPGGLVDPGEDIHTAACREVRHAAAQWRPVCPLVTCV